MKAYEYRGFDREGKACRGLVDALSVKDAREKLSRDGILADRISTTGRKLRFPVDQRAIVYRELSVLLKAGMPLVKALDMIIQSPEMDECRVLVAGVRDSVKEGARLADALSAASGSVSSFEKAIIETAEKSATVEPMLERLAMFLEEQEKLRDKIQGALIYPSIVFTVGVCVAVVMLGLLLPKTTDILKGSKVALPLLTVMMLALGKFIMKWGLLCLLVVAGGGYYAWWKISGSDVLLTSLNRKLFRLPLFGKGYAMVVNLRFSRTLAVLIGGGVSLIDGLVLAGKATGSKWVAHLAGKEAETVRHGGRLSEAVRRIPPLSGSLPGWIEVGEASGGLERLLDSAGDRFQHQWDRYVNRCLSFLEPVLILVIGVFVLLVVLSVLLPILSLTRTIGK